MLAELATRVAAGRAGEKRRLDGNPFDFIEGDVITGTVIEHGGARALMTGDLAGMFELAGIGEIGDDAVSPEGMTGEGRGEAGVDGPVLIMASNLSGLQATGGEAAFAVQSAEEGGLLSFPVRPAASI